MTSAAVNLAERAQRPASQAANGDCFARYGLPSAKLERWRQSPPRPLVSFELQAVDALPASLALADRARLVFRDGVLDMKSSCLAAGISLSCDRPPLALAAQVYDDPDRALCAAAAQTMPWVLTVVAGAKATIDIEHRQSPDVASAYNVILVVGANASLQINESFAGDAGWVNVLLQADLAAAANVVHVDHQALSTGGHRTVSRDIAVGDGACWRSFSLDIGARYSRVDHRVRLADAEAHAALNGVLATFDKQVQDQHWQVQHQVGPTTSEMTLRAVAQQGKAVGNGKVIIDEFADAANAQQDNAGLLLADAAQIDLKPELEIYAEDVKAAHGATIGALDRDALFYLVSRGVSPQRARSMLLAAFTRSVFDSLADEQAEPLRDAFQAHLGLQQ